MKRRSGPGESDVSDVPTASCNHSLLNQSIRLENAEATPEPSQLSRYVHLFQRVEKPILPLIKQHTFPEDWRAVHQQAPRGPGALIADMIGGGEYSDITVQVGAISFKCSRLLLNSYSRMFEQMSANVKHVKLDETKIGVTAFCKVYEWMKTDNGRVAPSDFLQVLMAAQYMDVRDLRDQCFALMDSLSEDTACCFYLNLRAMGMKLPGERSLLTRMGRYFLTFLSTLDFLLLTPHEVHDLLKSDSVSVHCEAEIFMAAIHWMDYEWEQRKVYALTLMHCVRFQLMTIPYLTFLLNGIECPKVAEVLNNQDVNQLVEDSFMNNIMKKQNPENIKEVLYVGHIEDVKERPWIRQSEGSDIAPMAIFTYRLFKAFLIKVQEAGDGYWKTLEYVKSFKEASQRGVEVNGTVEAAAIAVEPQ